MTSHHHESGLIYFMYSHSVNPFYKLETRLRALVKQ